MAMRQDCRHFESHTLSSGEALSKCVLNLAPEAPWRCPVDCKSYERRRVNVNLTYQGIASSELPDAPDSISKDDGSVGDLLEDVGQIIGEAAPSIIAEVQKEAKQSKGWRKAIPRRKKRRPGKSGKK